MIIMENKNDISQKNWTEKIKTSYSQNIYDGWACGNLEYENEIIAENNGAETSYFEIKSLNLNEVSVRRRIEEDGIQVPEPDWGAFAEALADEKFLEIQRDYSDCIVLLCNSYEFETDEGFADTYYIRDATTEEKSSHGWNVACPVSEIKERYSSELIAWAEETRNYSFYS